MEARGWSPDLVAVLMGGTTPKERAIDRVTLDFILYVDDPDLNLGENTAQKLGLAFGIDAQYFLNLEAAYKAWRKSQVAIPAPDALADGRGK